MYNILLGRTNIFDTSCMKGIETNYIYDTATYLADQLERSKLNNRYEYRYLIKWIREEFNNAISLYFLSVRGPRGTIFHIMPGNLDTLVIFNLLISMLCGNYNVIRVSNKINNSFYDLIEVVKKTFSNELLNSFTILQSDYSFVEEYSKIVDVRAIWGSNKSVKKIKMMETKPKCLDLCFSNRFSVALINPVFRPMWGDRDITRIAKDFYNDVFWNFQGVCTSPKLIFWLGSEESSLDFWYEVESCAYQNDMKYKRLEKITEFTMEHNAKDTKQFESFDVITIDKDFKLINNVNKYSGYGLFFQVFVKDIEEFAEYITPEYQRLSYHGVTCEEILDNIIETPGVDSINKLGESSEFSIFWDGYNLVDSYSRLISV